MITKGAVDVLLNRVCSIQKDSGIVPITEEDRRAIEEQNQKFSGNGLRVLTYCIMSGVGKNTTMKIYIGVRINE